MSWAWTSFFSTTLSLSWSFMMKQKSVGMSPIRSYPSTNGTAAICYHCQDISVLEEWFLCPFCISSNLTKLYCVAISCLTLVSIHDIAIQFVEYQKMLKKNLYSDRNCEYWLKQNQYLIGKSNICISEKKNTQQIPNFKGIAYFFRWFFRTKKITVLKGCQKT